jgi:predicted regulator of Ras-like GTPase activity (Roadblock/LC7/MglB family)
MLPKAIPMPDFSQRFHVSMSWPATCYCNDSQTYFMHALKALWPGSTIKRWLGSQPSVAKPVAAPVPAKQPASAARVQPAVARTVPAPVPQQPKPAPAPTAANDQLLRLPLKPIFSRLSPALAALANAEQISDTDEIALQIDNILAQLPGGVVRISFGELRNSAPAGIFADQASHDYTLIDVPLSEILARIHPGLLSLPANRKKVEVPQDVMGVFGKDGTGTAVIAAPEPVQSIARQTKPAPSEPVTTPATPRARVVIPPPPPGGDVIQFTRTTAAPAPAAPTAPALSAIPMPPKVTRAVTPAAAPAQPIAMPAVAKAAPAAPAVPTAPAKPEPQIDPLVVALAGLTENWPAQIKAELDNVRPAAVSMSIPMPRLEAPMKTGKLRFAWSELRQWIKPAPLTGTSAHGETEIQLALNVIAPLFFAHPARNQAAKKKAEIAHDIPDVFGSASAANAIRELANVPVAKVNAPAAPTAPDASAMPFAPAVAAQGGSATNLQLRMAHPPSNGNGDGAPAVAPRMPELTENTVLFGKKPAVTPTAPAAHANGNGNGTRTEAPASFPKLDWTPETAVKVTCCTPGVAGAMITAEDGLMIATQLPPQFKSDTLSAFVPQIFQRAAQSAAELQLPALMAVRLTLGEQQCDIFKAGKVYYVIIGKPSEELPTPFLRKVAAELIKKN